MVNLLIHVGNILLFVILLVGIIALQIYLSKRKNKWLGLILPGVCLLVSLLAVVNLTVSPLTSVGQIVMLVFGTFLLFNISTLILLAIYFAFRRRERKQKELEKMRLQDLD